VSLLLINQELKSTTHNYAPFYAALKGNCAEWWHFMEHTWIVSTNHSADEYAKLLYPHMLRTDHLLVIKLQKDYQGWLPPEAWEWLNAKSY
jgi:hypothetical protein